MSKRPKDVVGNAVHVCRIAIGEIEDEGQDADAKSVPNRAKGGRIGGPKRAAALSPERRKEIAKRAAQARWADLKRVAG